MEGGDSMAETEKEPVSTIVVCTEGDCIHNDGENNCTKDTITISPGGQCDDYEED